jgi:hypothetical protein
MASEHRARARRVVRTRPRQTTEDITAENDARPKLSAGDKYVGDCPACGSEGTLGFGLKEGHTRPWVKCFSCRAEGLTPGDELRALADAVGAPGPSYVLEYPRRWLSEFCEQDTATGEPRWSLPSPESVSNRASRLRKNRSALAYMASRGLTKRTLRRNGVGWENEALAFTFPINNAQGELVNFIRRPYPTVDPDRKYLIEQGRGRDNGGIQLYPHPLPKRQWLLVAGLLDALIGRQHGLPTVTSTNGAGTFLDEWYPLVRSRRVAVMFDVGEEGAADVIVQKMRQVGAEAWLVRLSELDLPPKADLTDALTGGYTADDIKELIRSERTRGRRTRP